MTTLGSTVVAEAISALAAVVLDFQLDASSQALTPQSSSLAKAVRKLNTHRITTALESQHGCSSSSSSDKEEEEEEEESDRDRGNEGEEQDWDVCRESTRNRKKTFIERSSVSAAEFERILRECSMITTTTSPSSSSSSSSSSSAHTTKKSPSSHSPHTRGRRGRSSNSSLSDSESEDPVPSSSTLTTTSTASSSSSSSSSNNNNNNNKNNSDISPSHSFVKNLKVHSVSAIVAVIAGFAFAVVDVKDAILLPAHTHSSSNTSSNTTTTAAPTTSNYSYSIHTGFSCVQVTTSRQQPQDMTIVTATTSTGVKAKLRPIHQKADHTAGASSTSPSPHINNNNNNNKHKLEFVTLLSSTLSHEALHLTSTWQNNKSSSTKSDKRALVSSSSCVSVTLCVPTQSEIGESKTVLHLTRRYLVPVWNEGHTLCLCLPSPSSSLSLSSSSCVLDAPDSASSNATVISPSASSVSIHVISYDKQFGGIAGIVCPSHNAVLVRGMKTDHHHEEEEQQEEEQRNYDKPKRRRKNNNTQNDEDDEVFVSISMSQAQQDEDDENETSSSLAVESSSVHGHHQQQKKPNQTNHSEIIYRHPVTNAERPIVLMIEPGNLAVNWNASLYSSTSSPSSSSSSSSSAVSLSSSSSSSSSLNNPSLQSTAITFPPGIESLFAWILEKTTSQQQMQMQGQGIGKQLITTSTSQSGLVKSSHASFSASTSSLLKHQRLPQQPQQQEIVALSPSSLPKHIAVVMDGNGRWATSRHLSRSAGHRAGVDAIHTLIRCCRRLRIPFLTLYAFSAQNWSRPEEEVRILMTLLAEFVATDLSELCANGVRLLVNGDIGKLPAPARAGLQRMISSSSKNVDGLTLCLALSYGGREEIVGATAAACRAAQAGLVDPELLTTESFRLFFPHPQVPDPDLLIRTSGEMRVSNFLLWQIAYTELYVTNTLWPDFDDAELMNALVAYAGRERRFGKTSAQIVKEEEEEEESLEGSDGGKAKNKKMKNKKDQQQKKSNKYTSEIMQDTSTEKQAILSGNNNDNIHQQLTFAASLTNAASVVVAAVSTFGQQQPQQPNETINKIGSSSVYAPKSAVNTHHDKKKANKSHHHHKHHTHHRSHASHHHHRVAVSSSSFSSSSDSEDDNTNQNEEDGEEEGNDSLTMTIRLGRGGAGGNNNSGSISSSSSSNALAKRRGRGTNAGGGVGEGSSRSSVQSHNTNNKYSRRSNVLYFVLCGCFEWVCQSISTAFCCLCPPAATLSVSLTIQNVAPSILFIVLLLFPLLTAAGLTARFISASSSSTCSSGAGGGGGEPGSNTNDVGAWDVFGSSICRGGR